VSFYIIFFRGLLSLARPPVTAGSLAAREHQYSCQVTYERAPRTLSGHCWCLLRVEYPEIDQCGPARHNRPPLFKRSQFTRISLFCPVPVVKTDSDAALTLRLQQPGQT